ncbi:HAD family hydrolase [Oscillibacter sp.]|jgi:Cof subfamily protein (haloacid dehalogenase superfamily)|uniref:HAD family hydrolase n=1 Tax=Oscillibacter sp. TaxID=1945593 RepID=UPI00216DB0BD|nr:HAD family hydrolase [Oscillibacter sp.]MCI9649788.1 HAD family phosphatase [Oscillibacter sp.]
MVKLIASDIDGTLLSYGETALPSALFDLIRRLRSAGVLFCPASGRQYHSLRQLFAPAADEVCFLCENGAVVFGPGTEESAPVLSKTPMPRQETLDLIRDIAALPESYALVSGQNISYLHRWPEKLAADFRYWTGNLVRPVDRAEDIREDIVKVSACCPSPAAAAEALGPRWEKKFHMAEAGPIWLDFTLADKGAGLRGLCRSLGVDLAETMAFGDNWNDVPMLEAAGTPWLMASAVPALRERFSRQCAGVLPVLEELLAELGA